MSAKLTRHRWASRVDPRKIRRLYRSDAEGMLDEDLLDDVGYGIYVRCQALLEVAAAWRGRVKCWQCGNAIHRRQGKMVGYTGHGPTLIGGQGEVLQCDRCGWQITWAAYRKSIPGENLDATGLEDMLQSFVERWPTVRSPHARLLLIDALIHEFHCWDGNTIGSPVGATLIRATSEGVLALLDDLAFGPASTRGLQQTQQRWASRLEAKKAQRPLSELRAIARELGIQGRSRMRRAELQAAIERVAPDRIVRSAQ
jgi:ribosomal protein L37AE/L43A